MEHASPSRRQFLTAVGNLASASWVALNWPSIAAAAPAEHAHAGHAMANGAPPTSFTTLNPLEAADVDAIADLIVPGGAKPGARAAGVPYFIDNALGSFFKDQLGAFRQGLAEFQAGFARQTGVSTPFAKAVPDQQTAYLGQVEKTPFFQAVRRLTVLGLLALPKYGGNRDNIGWTLIGVEDNHYWEPPFGYYDKDYPGFQPYPGTKPYTA